MDREVARRQWAINRRSILSIGHLIERKGHDLVIRALERIDDVDLLIAGEGPERPALQRLVDKLGMLERVRFLGVIDQRALPSLYGAADALVLASSREGWPNVLLEALACGTPVIATRNWGTPEIVTSADAGLLVNERTPEALADAILHLLRSPPARTATRRFAEAFSWDATTAGQLDLFSSLLARDKVTLAA
jgi:glycosyltransferase involved in cell wall biosynthesis